MSAYVTFTNKESVDKAVAWSGNSFLSRPIKVRNYVSSSREPLDLVNLYLAMGLRGSMFSRT